MKKYLFGIVVIAGFAACHSADYNTEPSKIDSLAATIKQESFGRYIHTFNDSILENKITDTLIKLPFVKKSNDYIDSFSNHAHGISFMLDTAENQISVSAGYNGPDRFENYYLFKVDPKTMKIMVNDVISGDWISVEKYMKLKAEE